MKLLFQGLAAFVFVFLQLHSQFLQTFAFSTLQINMDSRGYSKNKKYDVIVWGASGFTGSKVSEYLLSNYGASPKDFKWAIGGRSEKKLNDLKNALQEYSADAGDIPIVLGDSSDKESLKNLVEQTKVILTTVGPYQKYGQPLVEACVEGGIGYCDLTGETFWIQENIEKYHKKAQETGAKIVHCCGFDSVPSEMGTLMLAEYMKKKYDGSLSLVQNLMVDASGGVSGGTIASLFGQAELYRGMSKEERAKRGGYYMLVPKDNKPPENSEGWDKTNGGFGYQGDLEKWTGPFVMAGINAQVVRRSNALMSNYYGSPFRYEEVSAFPKGIGGMIGAMLVSAITALAAPLLYFNTTRNFIQKRLPQPGQGPSRDMCDNGFFKFNIVGKGKAKGMDQPITLVGEVGSTEGDGGYKETSKMLAESALCLALAASALPDRAGVLTPATAMGVALIERLKKAKMTLKVISDSGPGEVMQMGKIEGKKEMDSALSS